jgi:hypothetical protein
MPHDLAYVNYPRCPGLVHSPEAYRSAALILSFDECTGGVGVRHHVLDLIIVSAADMAQKLPTATGSA